MSGASAGFVGRVFARFRGKMFWQATWLRHVDVWGSALIWCGFVMAGMTMLRWHILVVEENVLVPGKDVLGPQPLLHFFNYYYY